MLGPDTSADYIPAYAVCGPTLACELGSWGGAYLVFNFSSLPGRAGNYKLSTIPDNVISFHANYITDEHSWGRAGATVGVTYVTKTSGTIENAISYPAYSLVNLSAFYQRVHRRWTSTSITCSTTSISPPIPTRPTKTSRRSRASGASGG